MVVGICLRKLGFILLRPRPNAATGRIANGGQHESMDVIRRSQLPTPPAPVAAGSVLRACCHPERSIRGSR